VSEPFDVDGWLGRTAPAEGSEIQIVIASFDVFCFRRPVGFGEYKQDRKDAEKRARQWLSPGQFPPEWKDWKIADQEGLEHVYLFALYCVRVRIFTEMVESVPQYQEVEPFGQLAFLKLAKRNPGAFAAMIDKFKQSTGEVAIAYEVNAIHEAKKG
jgi:hypothetical protein